ncbi:MAG: hypothetical protein HDR27_11900 [Lachnospiraceae bacterium]|nr:hypothetical protein [Lachnospiraceae bacterium]
MDSRMVNRVDGNRYYEYTKMKNVSVSDTGEKFSLDHKQDELSNEKEKRDKEVSEQEKQQAAEKAGVKVELSGYGRAVGTLDRQRTDPVKKGADAGQIQSLLASVQEIFRTAIAAFKDFFDKIWNEPKTEESVQAEAVEQEREDSQAIQETAPPVETAEDFYQNEARLNQEIQPYLRKGDLNQVINLLTDNGKKTAARNSTLLTYYDRNGRMVEPSASDSQRILYGDRNARKL